MANVKIYDMTPIVTVVADTVVPGLSTDDPGPGNNVKITAAQLAQFISGYIASLTGFAYVGTGAQYTYHSIYQAWTALSGLGEPVRLFVANDIVEDGDIALDVTTPPLVVRINSNTDIDYGDFMITCTNDANVSVEFGGGGGSTVTISYAAMQAGGFMDFASTQPASIYQNISNFTLINNSDPVAIACSPFASLPGIPTVCIVNNIEIVLPSNSVGYSLFTNAQINGLKITGNISGLSNSAFDVFGNSTVKNVIFGENFANGALMCQFEKDVTVDTIINDSASSDLIIRTQGGNMTNIMGSFNIDIEGGEIDSLYPSITNATNAKLTMTSVAGDSNGAANVTNSYIRDIVGTGVTTGSFKMLNCSFADTFTDVPSFGLWKFTSCQFEGGIDNAQDNTVFDNCSTGKTNDGASTATITISGGSNSVVSDAQTKIAIVDSGTSTELIANKLY